MIPVAPDHLLDILHGEVLPVFVADVLPAGDFLEHQQAVFVAGVEKMRRLRIMRRADDVAVQLLSQYPRIALLTSRRHRLADKRKRLMPIEAAQLQMFAVEVETFGRELRFAKTDAGFVLIDDALSFRQPNDSLDRALGDRYSKARCPEYWSASSRNESWPLGCDFAALRCDHSIAFDQ